MKLGAENRKELITVVALAVVAIPLFLRMVVGGGTPTQAAAPQPRPGPAARVVRQIRHGQPANDLLQPSLDPTLKLEALKSSEAIEYKGGGRNIFDYQALPLPELPKQLDCAFKDKTNPKCKGWTPPPPPGPPPPPPIPLKFYGFASRPGQPKQIFLSDGDNVFVAKEGDIVDKQYRVVQIGPASVLIEDMLHNNRQSIPLSG